MDALSYFWIESTSVLELRLWTFFKKVSDNSKHWVLFFFKFKTNIWSLVYVSNIHRNFDTALNENVKAPPPKNAFLSPEFLSISEVSVYM